MPNPDSQLAVLPQCALARQVEPSAWNALKEIYDDASDEKVALVIDYCKARRLDPLKKPVHIVSVWSNRRKAMVETIWPSISEIRITAMRTGLFAGQDETKFGPTLTQKLGNVEVTFPEWAQITVYRMVGSQRCAFPGPRCYFLESYATRRKDDYAPNAMWEKRTWGQLEKCAEAAALRRAFPEELGGQATAEEAGGRATEEPINVTSSASESTTTPTDAPPPEVKRAAVPRKNKGAAAATVTDVTVAAATPPAAIPVEATPVPEPTPEPVKTVTPEPTPEPEPTPAPEPTQPPAPAPQPAPAAAAKEWPQVVIGNVVDAKDAKVTGNPKYTSVRVLRLGNGEIKIGGAIVQLHEAGNFIVDPERPELAKFAVVSAEKISFTIDEIPSASNPAKKNRVIIKALS